MRIKVRIFFRMTLIEQLLLVAETYGKFTGLAEATVSARFAGRGARIGELRHGGDMGARTIARSLQKFSEMWPEGAEWPEGVDQPETVSKDVA